MVLIADLIGKMSNKTNTTVCTKTIWTTVDILSDVNLCYAGHIQATQDILRKSKDNKQNLFFEDFNTFMH